MAQQNAPTAAPKVAPADGEKKAKKQKREKKVKPSLPPELSVGANGKTAVNEAGKFTQVPVKWTRQYKGLKEKDFVDEATFIEFQAHVREQGIADEMSKIKALRAEAASIRKIGGNPKIVKTVRKVQKMRSAMAEMLAALKEEGIEV